MKRVLATGTFDLVHKGHIQFLRQAKALGTHLTVVIARDETVKKVKGKMPMHSEQQRLQDISLVPSVDEALLGNVGDKYWIIEQIKPDIIALGYDQTHFIDALKDELQKRGLSTKVIRCEPYKQTGYKSSILKQVLPQTRL